MVRLFHSKKQIAHYRGMYKQLITTNPTSSYIDYICVLTDVVHLKDVTKSSLKYYGMLDSQQETNCSLNFTSNIIDWCVQTDVVHILEDVTKS